MADKTKQQKKKRAVPDGDDPFPVFEPGELPLEDEHHERFCQELLMLKPLVRAYQISFPESSYNSARANSCRLAKLPAVTERLAWLKAEQRGRLRMEAEDVHTRLVMAANVDPADLVDDSGQPLPLHKLPPEVRLCIESVEVTRRKARKPGTKGETAEVEKTKIELISKRAALELIGRQHKMFTDKVEHSGKVTLEELVGGGE